MVNRVLVVKPIETLILFGGGYVLSRLALELSRVHELRTVVFSSSRHLDEELDEGSTLVTVLEQGALPHHETAEIADDQRLERYLGPRTVGISFGAAWLFPATLIDRFGGRLLNSHGAPLPEHRGAGGFSWRILMGDRRGASLLHQVTPRVDAGDVVVREDYTFPESCRIPIDFQRIAADKDLRMLRGFVKRIREGATLTLTPQAEGRETYFPRLHTPTHGFVDWSWSAAEIERFVCAFDDPYPGAGTQWKGRGVRLKGARPSTGEGPFHPFQAGLVFRTSADRVWVAAREGALSFEWVLGPEGEDLRHHLRAGDRFVTPVELLETALSYRAVYGPSGLKA